MVIWRQVGLDGQWHRIDLGVAFIIGFLDIAVWFDHHNTSRAFCNT